MDTEKAIRQLEIVRSRTVGVEKIVNSDLNISTPSSVVEAIQDLEHIEAQIRGIKRNLEVVLNKYLT